MPGFIYALWHGGGSYAVGDYADSTEVFETLTDAKDAFASRATDGYSWHQTFRYADGRTEMFYTPCVEVATPDDGGPTMHLYADDPREDSDPYPYREITFGPRGGVRVTPC